MALVLHGTQHRKARQQWLGAQWLGAMNDANAGREASQKEAESRHDKRTSGETCINGESEIGLRQLPRHLCAKWGFLSASLGVISASNRAMHIPLRVSPDFPASSLPVRNIGTL